MNPGDSLTPRVFTVTRDDLVGYAAASGDQNPIHQDEQVALSVGLPGVIAHGRYTLALVGTAVAEWTGGAEVVDLGAKFTSPVVVPAEGGAEVVVAGHGVQRQVQAVRHVLHEARLATACGAFDQHRQVVAPGVFEQLLFVVLRLVEGLGHYAYSQRVRPPR